MIKLIKRLFGCKHNRVDGIYNQQKFEFEYYCRKCNKRFSYDEIKEYYNRR